MQTIAALDAVKAAKLDARIPEIFFGLTEPAKSGKRNGLRELLAAHKVAMLDHDTGVGGRYSALTNVGLLPAAALGLDIAAIRAGAGAALAPVLAGQISRRGAGGRRRGACRSRSRRAKARPSR